MLVLVPIAHLLKRSRERERELVKWIVGAGIGLVVLGFLLASPWVLSVVHSKTCQLVYTWFELRSDEQGGLLTTTPIFYFST